MTLLAWWALFGALTSIIVSYTRKLTFPILLVAFIGGPLLFTVGVVDSLYIVCIKKGEQDGD